MSWQQQMDQIVAAFHDAHPFTRGRITMGDHHLDVFIADTPAQWARGMTNLTFADTEGMLFVVPPGSTYEFHTTNVPFDVFIAFYDEHRTLIDHGVMPARKGRKKAKQPYAYALELPAERADLTDDVTTWTYLTARLEKMSKAVAHYRTAPDPAMSCATCTHYKNGVCELITGTISPTAVCDFFTPNEAPAMDPAEPY